MLIPIPINILIPQPFDDWGNNYIRNSGEKLITDAYSGEVNFLHCDDSDPIVNTLRKVFPNLLNQLMKCRLI